VNNAFCGVSQLCYMSNLRHHLLIAFYLFQRQRGDYQLLVTSMENPEAGRQLHPLTTRVAEAPSINGGLEMGKVTLHYCQVFSWLHKPTNLWLKSPKGALLREFAELDWDDKAGELRCKMKYLCLSKGPCHQHNQHYKASRPEAGMQDVRVDRGSIYPRFLVAKMASTTMLELKHIRTINEDAADGQDGNGAFCEVCDCTDSRRPAGTAKDLVCCDACPRVYHRKCIPSSVPKPRNGDASWHCLHLECKSSKAHMLGSAQLC